MRLLGFVLLVNFVAGALASCGCLKCSKHLRVVSPASAPVKVIYRDGPSCNCPKNIQYAVQHPAVLPSVKSCKLTTVGYKVDTLGSLPGSINKPCPKLYQYAYQVQKPVVTPTSCPELICGLVARPDRIIVPAVEKHCVYKQPRVQTKVIFEPYPCEEEDDYILPAGYEAIRPAVYDRYLPEEFNYPVKSIKKRSINFDNLLKANTGSDISDEFISLDAIERTLNKLGEDSLLNGYSKSYVTENIFMPKNINNRNQEQVQKDQIREAIHAITSNNRKSFSSDKRGTKHLLEESKLLGKLKTNPVSIDIMNKNKCGRHQPVINIHNLHVYNDKHNFEAARKKLIPTSTHGGLSTSPFKSQSVKLPQQPFRIEKFFKKEPTSNKHQRLSIKKPQRTAKKKSKSNQEIAQRSVWVDHINSQDDLEGSRFTALNREKRALFMNGNSFYRVTEDSGQILDEETDYTVNNLLTIKNSDEEKSFENTLFESREDSNDNFEEIVQQGRKKVEGTVTSINYDTILPQTPFLYFFNIPLKILNHFHDLTRHFSPILQTVPSVFKKSTNYLNNFNDKIKKHAIDFVSTVIGDFENQHEIDLQHLDSNIRTKSRMNSRDKRELLKLIDEDELQEFLREKLSVFQDEEMEEIYSPPKEIWKKFKIEKVDPKIIVDRNGKTFLDIDGSKSPILDVNKKIMRINKERFRKSRGKISIQDTVNIDDYNLQKSISEIIAQAKNIVGQPNIYVEHYDIDRSRQSIKDKINDILYNIQLLIHANFSEDAKIFGPILDLQNRQKTIVDMWKKSLVNLKHNEISEKIKILSGIQEIQKLKGEIVVNLIRVLSKGRNYYSNKFIKILIRLQKLQCVLIKVVEEFGERIRLGTKFDVHNEIKYIETLNKIHFTDHQQISEIEQDLKKERDAKLEEDMKLIEQLRKMLEENKEDTIEQEAKLLWELKNIEKLQINSLVEVKDNIVRGLTIRRELKIIFDLEKQLGKCEIEQTNLLGKVMAMDKEKKFVDEKEKVALKPTKLKKFEFKLKLPKKIFTTKKPVVKKHNTYN